MMKRTLRAQKNKIEDLNAKIEQGEIGKKTIREKAKIDITTNKDFSERLENIERLLGLREDLGA